MANSFSASSTAKTSSLAISAQPAPLNVYGRHKLEAERVVAATVRDRVVVRSCNVYGYQPGGKNFVMAVLEYARAGGKLRALPVGFLDDAIGAVRLNSSVADLSKWIRLQLGRGTFEGKKIFSQEQSWTMWQPNTIQTIAKRPNSVAQCREPGNTPR